MVLKESVHNQWMSLTKHSKTALSSNVATVIDIPIDPEEDVLPFVAPGTSLAGYGTAFLGD